MNRLAGRQDKMIDQLPPLLCEQNPNVSREIYAVDVVVPDNNWNTAERLKNAKWWLENRLVEFYPLHWLQKAELRRIFRWHQQGNVVEIERGIVRIIDLEVWKH